MATKIKHDGKLQTITTPSRYGSHASMVVQELNETDVMCMDDSGTYITQKDRLDNGLTDSNRLYNRIESA